MSSGEETIQRRSFSGSRMTCAHACQLLAASRRDEWTPEEMTALSEHLSTCVACRQRQEAYRGVGERVRQLPTIIPPPSFKARVFAAIEADQAQRESPATRLARADTDPAIPIVRAYPRNVRRRAPQRHAPQPQVVRVVAALAAVLVFAVLASQAVNGFSSGSLSNAFSHILPGTSARPLMATYDLGGNYRAVSDAVAGKTWVVSAAAAQKGASDQTLLALDRATGKTTPLLGTLPNSNKEIPGPLRIVAVNDSVVVWTEGNPLDVHANHNQVWSLNVSRLPVKDGADVGAPLGLASGIPADEPGHPAGSYDILTGASLSGNTLLFTSLDSTMGGVMNICDVTPAGPVGVTSSATSQFVVAGAGHVVSDPVRIGSTDYWADAWVDGEGHLHSAIVRGGTPGHAETVVPDGAFAPHAAGSKLAYLSATNAQAPTSGGLPALAQAVTQVRGTLVVRDLASGKTATVAHDVNAATLSSGGPVVLYQGADGEHTYDVATGKPLAVDSDVRKSAYVGVTASALTWGGGNSTLQVYNLPPA